MLSDRFQLWVQLFGPPTTIRVTKVTQAAKPIPTKARNVNVVKMVGANERRHVAEIRIVSLTRNLMHRHRPARRSVKAEVTRMIAITRGILRGRRKSPEGKTIVMKVGATERTTARKASQQKTRVKARNGEFPHPLRNQKAMPLPEDQNPNQSRNALRRRPRL